jgi:malonyl-CoA O-methyltransferase
LERELRTPDGRLQLTFEVVYGHAFKPIPRFVMRAESRVPLTQLKSALGKKN